MYQILTRVTRLLPAACLLGLFSMTRIVAAIEVGEAMPDFSLPASDGKTYTLSQFKGKQPVVIAFFPMAFTPGWTIQCKALRDSANEIQKYDVAYFMASVDDLEKNTKFAQEHNAGFPILADPGKELTGACDVLHEKGFANRWTYFVDKDGIVVKIDKEVNPQTAGADLARILGELGFPKK